MKNKRIKGRTWLFLCAALLIITHVLFKMPAPFLWLEHVWGAGDFITFAGTIVLGYVAYWQTNNANEISDRLLRIEESRYNLELRPFIMITDYKAYAKKEIDIVKNPDKIYISISESDDTENVLCLEFSITNTTNSFITVRYDGAYSEKAIRWRHSMANQKSDIIPIQPNDEGIFILYAPPSFIQSSFLSERVHLSFILENRLSKRYKEHITILTTSLSCNTVGCSPDGNWFLSMDIQDYSMDRLEKTGVGSFAVIKEEL